MILNPRKRYLQIALNSSLDDAKNIISQLPVSDRIIVEAGTPLIKAYGASAIRQIRSWCEERTFFSSFSGIASNPNQSLTSIANKIISSRGLIGVSAAEKNDYTGPYVVADLKTMDRGDREAEIAARSGASAAICLGEAPIETINSFIGACKSLRIDSMIDMMNVEYPLGVLRKLKTTPDVVIVHRGVDEEKFNKEKMIPLHEIHRIKGAYDIMISIAGGDSIREVQRAIFNDADIVVVWKEFYQSTAETASLADQFLKEIK